MDMDNPDMELIPLQILEHITKNRNNVKKSLMVGSPVKMQQATKDALFLLKKQNNLVSVSAVIDMLIATVALGQYASGDYDMELARETIKIRNKNGGNNRPCTIMGRNFYSINDAAKYHGCAPMTVFNRIRNTKNVGLRNWNYDDDNLELKYDERRIN